VFFVIRHKDNINFKSVKENQLPDDHHGHILIDEIIELTGSQTKSKYPKKLRKVAVWDEENEQEIKQLLHIKSFIGTSENAVMIQIWTALITILVLKALRAMAKYPWYLSNLVAFIRLNIFVKINLQNWLDQPFVDPEPQPENNRQGVLF